MRQNVQACFVMTLIICGVALPLVASDVIQQARQKILSRDRKGAAEILQTAINREKMRPRQQELIEELHKLTALFISDEGQRAFELANAIRFSGQGNYMPKYNEAIKADPDNWSIYFYQALGHLQQKNCKQALVVTELAAAIDPYRGEDSFLKTKIKLCSNDIVPPELVARILFSDERKIHKDVILSQIAATNQRPEEALRYAAQAILADKNFPMGYYWSWSVSKENESRGLTFAQKYSSLCRGMTSILRQKYYLEPELCLDLDSVENYIKKMEAGP